MKGIYAVYRKELADHFTSYRFVILFALIAMISFITSYMAGIQLRENMKEQFIFLMLFNKTGALFSMIQFVGFFGPLIGLVLGFDSINRERAHGTLIKLVSQPIYRDAVINGKFLAGATTISIILVAIVMGISGFGLTLLGVVPSIEEIWRLIVYIIISIFYISFWLALSMLFSIFFKNIATSALASVALWIFLSFFVYIGANIVSDAIVPIESMAPENADMIIKNTEVKEAVSLLSPMVLYQHASATIINPMQNTTKTLVLMGPMEEYSASRFQNALPLGQSIIVVYPYIVVLIGITLICFAISYIVFMLQEVRT